MLTSVIAVMGIGIHRIDILLIVAVYSLLPDIDHPNSYATRGTGNLFGLIMCGAFGHRGIFHSILMGIVMAIPVYGMYQSNVPFYFAIGSYTIHLICDMGDKVAIPLFYPYKKRYKF